MQKFVKPSWRAMKKFHHLLYLQQYISHAAPIFPLYAIMFGDKGGLSLAHISVLFMWWLAVMVAAEIPTSVIADKLSYKWSVVVGCLLTAACYLTWWLVPNFYGFALGFLFSGIGYAFSSGAFQAYVYTELEATKNTKDYAKILSRSQSMAGLGITTGFLSAAIVGKNFELALAISIVASCIGALLAASFPVKSRHERPKDRFLQHLKQAAREVKYNNTALVYALASAVMFSIGGSAEEYLPPFYNHIGFSPHVMPLLVAAGIAFGSALGWFAHRMQHATFWVLSGSVALIGVIALLCTAGNQWVALVGMFVFLRVVKIASMLFDASLQHVIKSNRRATVTSLATFMGEVIEVACFGAIALAAFVWGDMNGYRTIAVTAIALSVGLLVIGYAKRVPQRVAITEVPEVEEVKIAA